MGILHSFKQLQKSSISASAFVVAVASVISLVLGLLRERLLLYFVGQGQELDMYFAAFKLPDILYAIGISFAGAYVLIPFLHKSKDDAELNESFSSIFKSFILFALLSASFAFVFTPFYLSYAFPNIYFSPLQEEFVFLSRMLLLQYILLLSFQLFQSLLQMQKDFLSFAFLPLLYNLGIIFGIVFLYPLYSVSGIVYALLVALFVQLVLAYSRQTKWRLSKTTLSASFKASLKMLKASYPRAISLLLQQLNIFTIFVFLAPFAGAISAFQVASNLQAAPMSVFALSFITAAFPTLVQKYDSANKDAFIQTARKTISQILFWIIPISMLLVLMSYPLVVIVYGSNAKADLVNLSLLFSILVLSLPYQALSISLSNLYYAASKAAKPIFYQVVFMVILIILLFVDPVRSFMLNYITNTFLLDLNPELYSAFVWLLSSAVSSIFYFLLFKHDFKLRFYEFLGLELLAIVASAIFAFAATFMFTKYFVVNNVWLQAIFVSVVFTVFYLFAMALSFKLDLKKLLFILKGQ